MAIRLYFSLWVPYDFPMQIRLYYTSKVSYEFPMKIGTVSHIGFGILAECAAYGFRSARLSPLNVSNRKQP